LDVVPEDLISGVKTYPKFDITDFTQNPSDVLREIKKRLYSHLVPENTFPFDKLQSNFIY
jgi:hypothetical protein